MILTKCFKYRRQVIWILMLPLLMLLLDVPAFASEKIEDDIRVENIDFQVQADIVVITYDLIGLLTEKFDINIVLLREKDQSFHFVPVSVSGDIGSGVNPGLKKRIRWDYRKDFPKGLQGEDFYFEVSAIQPGGSSWFLYVLGVAAVGGGAIFLASKKNDSAVSPTTDATLPMPPIRPLQ